MRATTCFAGVLLAISLLLPSRAGAERKPERIALSDLLDATSQHSPGIAIARADRDEAHERIDAAEAIDDWHLVVRGSGQDQAVDRTLVGPGDAIDTRTVTGEVGLEKSLPTGGDIKVAAALGSVDYLYPPIAAKSDAPDVALGGVTATAKLAASHAILRGAGSAVARADEELAKLGARTQSAQALDDAAGLVRDLVVGYWELAYATEALAVDREAEALAVRQVAITADVVKNGMQPPSAVKIAELQVALHREAILRDETTISDQSLALRRLAGMPIESTPLAPTDPIDPPKGALAESDAIAAALARGPGMTQKKLAQHGGDVAVGVAESGALPRLDATVGGEVGGVGATTGHAIGRIGEAQMYTLSAALTLQWDIGSSARSAEAAAHVHRVRLDAERAELEHQLVAAAIAAVRQLDVAKQRIELSQIAVDVAADALHSEVVAFQGGRSTNVAVFQREDDVAQAKLRLARARVDAVQAGVAIDYVTGNLLRHYGMTLEKRRQR